MYTWIIEKAEILVHDPVKEDQVEARCTEVSLTQEIYTYSRANLLSEGSWSAQGPSRLLSELDDPDHQLAIWSEDHELVQASKDL